MEKLYPLAQVLEIKNNRVAEAERNVKRKEELLQKELDILEEKKRERDKVRQHKDDKLQQLRDELDGGTTSDKVEQMKQYLEICKEKVLVEDKKVAEQEEQVELAEKNVQVAKSELKQRRLEVDKLEEHREGWLKEYIKELEFEEAKELDELGELMFNLRKRRGY